MKNCINNVSSDAKVSGNLRHELQNVKQKVIFSLSDILQETPFLLTRYIYVIW